MKMPFSNHGLALQSNGCLVGSLWHDQSRCSARAFNRLELLALVGAVSLLMLVSAPLGANVRTRTDRLVCEANLRQIGHAYQLWASDHGDRNPIW